MTIDFTINLGHIISLVGTLILFVTWAQGLKWNMLNLDKRLEVVESNMKQQTDLIIANAVVNTNIMSLTDKLATLERRMSQYEGRQKTRV